MLRSGQILQNRYHLQQSLGQQPLGHHALRQTWLAVDQGLPTEMVADPAIPAKPVVIKLLPFCAAMQWDDLKLFEREAHILQQLHHPRIPRYYDAWTIAPENEAGWHWFGLVQEYIPGASLQQLLNQGQRFTTAQVWDMAAQVLEILIHLHQLSPPVLHRDIKPSNLILGDDRQVYLVDFGSVQVHERRMGVSFTVVGTAGYTPMEQFWGRSLPASDLYALGTTLIHLLTGVAPANLPQHNLQLQFTDLVSLPPAWVNWLQWLTHPDLTQRCSTAVQALSALQATQSSPETLLGDRQFSVIPSRNPSMPENSNASQQGKAQRAKNALIVGTILNLLIWIPTVLDWPMPWQVFLPGLLALSPLLPLPWWGNPVKALATERSGEFVPTMQFVSPPALMRCAIALSQETFVIERQFGYFCFYRQAGETANIEAIGLTASQSLFIQTKMAQYQFGEELSDIERHWLVQEMQQWLRQVQGGKAIAHSVLDATNSAEDT